MSSLSPFPQNTGGTNNYMSVLTTDEDGHTINPNAPLLTPSQQATPYSKQTSTLEDDEEMRSEITREEDVLTHYQEEVKREASTASYWGCITAVTAVFVFVCCLVVLHFFVN